MTTRFACEFPPAFDIIPERLVFDSQGQSLPSYKVTLLGQTQVVLRPSDSPRSLPICSISASQRLSSLLSRVVAVWVFYQNKTYSRGSGFYVSPNQILTCFHVIVPESSPIRKILVSSHPDAFNEFAPDVLSETFEEVELVFDRDSSPDDHDIITMVAPSRRWHFKSDLALLRCKSPSPDYFVPVCPPAALPTAILAAGYCGRVYEQVFANTDHLPFPPSLLAPAKRVSLGSIADQQPGFLKTLVSTSSGAGGSPIVPLDLQETSFFGIHVGCFPDSDSQSLNFNVAMSTSHPYFISLYKRFVAPEIAEDPRVAEFLASI